MPHAVIRRMLTVVAACAAAAPAGAASITVTTTAESPGASGDCTLGEAIEAANTDAAVDGCLAGNGADTITLPAGSYTLTVVQSTAAGESAFVVSTAITIVGPGAALARDAAVTDLRFFEVTSAGDLTLDRVSLSGGLAQGTVGVNSAPPFSIQTPGGPGRGGAIYNSGSLTLQGVVLSGNRATGGTGGNGWTSASSQGANGGVGQGGAVYNAGQLTALRATLRDNVATGGRGGNGFQDSAGGAGANGEGGALHNTDTATLTAIEVELAGNLATGGRSGFSSPSDLAPANAGIGAGGAVFSRGQASLTLAVLRANQAVGGIGSAAGAAGGGAIAAVAGMLALNRSTAIENSATGGRQSGGVPRPGGSGFGGGLYVAEATAELDRSAVVDNVAAGATSVWAQGGTGLGQGGGAFVAAATLSFVNTTLTGNYGADGGGGVLAPPPSTLIFQYATVTENGSAALAGGLVVGGGSTTLTGTIVANNASGNCAGAGTVTDGGSNLQFPGVTCGGIPIADPLLGPREAAARTVYHPLLPGSPARDAALTACPAEDQRGVARPFDGDGDGVAACDIGAIEANAPLAPGDLIFRDGFDSGDLAAWSTASTDGGDLSVNGAAALDGTAFGLQALVDDTAPLFVQDDTPEDEGRYRARFYLDPASFDPGTAAGAFRTRIFIGFADSPQRRLFAVVLKKQDAEYSVMVRARRDDNSQADTAFVPITPGTHFLEIDWRRASGPDANDGGLQLWVDGTSVASLTGLDNAAGGVDFVRLGALSIKAGASGPLRFDAFESRRTSSIGP